MSAVWEDQLAFDCRLESRVDSNSNSSPSILVARQPILDRDQRLAAYELLARSTDALDAHTPGDASATAGVLIGMLAEFGLERLVGDLPAFVNVTSEYLTGELPMPVAPGRVVVEVLETIEPDARALAGVARLKGLGFQIAIDDYVGPRPGYEPLLELADIVKVDCLAMDRREIARVAQSLLPFRARRLAEKIEDRATFHACRELGFDLFQGYFFARPDLSSTRAPSADRANLVHLLAELHKPDADLDDLEQIIARDAALTLKLVRVLNSAAFGLAREVSTLREILVYLGPPTVRDIASLLLLSRCDDKPRPLMLMAMQRARMCQRLSSFARSASAPRAFLVGLFSALDAILDQPIQEALKSLPLSEDVRAAILEHRGDLGTVLEIALAFEQGNWEALPKTRPSDAALLDASLESAAWVTQLDRQLGR
ncbi:MAG: HDOD domain-containing protein [Planctomycetota bacterium]|nr:MAG: HDOD domain-containing protein [Planctomycetota bacterium]